MEGIQPKISSTGNIKTNTVPTVSSSDQSPATPQNQPQRTVHDQNALNDFSSIVHKLVDLEMEQGCKSNPKNQPVSIGQGQNPEDQELTQITQCSKEQILAALHFLRISRRSGDKSIKSGQLSEADVVKVVSKGLYDTIEPSLEEQTNLTFAGRFFQGVEGETQGSPGMQAIMGELGLPFLSLASEDSEFTDSENHPAKNNLNLLDRISNAFDSNGQLSTKDGKQQLAQVLEQFAAASPQRLDEFLEISEQLGKILDPIEKKIILKNVSRVQETCEGNRKASQSRLYVENLIDTLLGGKNIPKIIVDLLDVGWKQLLILHNIKDGPDNPSQKKAIGIIETLLAWLKSDADFDPSNTQEIQEALSFIDTEMPTVCTDVQKHIGIMKELTACVVGEGNSKVRKLPEMVVFPERKVEEQSSPNTLVEPKLREYIHKVRQLKVGDWLQFGSKQEEKRSNYSDPP